MKEARQPATDQPADQSISTDREVMRLLDEALARYEDIMELADLVDGLDTGAAAPVEPTHMR